MKKRFAVFFITVIVVFMITYFPHSYLLNEIKGDYTTLFGMYSFHAISSLIVYFFIELVFYSIPNQTGFVFLASVFIKMGFFILIFSSYIYKDQGLEMFEKVAVIAPFFIFLIVESIFSFKLLNEA